MNALNPANVPEVRSVEWVQAAKVGCSGSQRNYLDDLLFRERIQPSELFGDGFCSTWQLSRWAAHWAIELLESRIEARSIEDDRRAFLDAQEAQLKKDMGIILRQIQAEQR